MPTVLITGASRGIGFEFVRQYAADGWRVLATCRTPAKAVALGALGANVELHALDVTDTPSVEALGRALAHETIDVLIANAGIYIARDMKVTQVDTKAWLDSFAINAIAPIACAGAFLAQVARSSERKMLAVSSAVGSVGNIVDGGYYVYRSSKAALNSAWRIFAVDPPEVIATLLSPGRVRTDMNPRAPLAPEESIAGLRRIIARLTPQDSGRFFRYDGQVLPL
ncbi:MAG TPA: SDR family oxidoreductase [Stellaceae bacterium]|nr:SDR family oxidoreductase [Stellaceae bacterium]